MEDEPAAGDRQIEASLVFGRAALVFAEERPVDQLDEDAAVLRRLDRGGDLDQPARGFSWIAVGAIGGEFHQSVPILAGAKCPRMSAPRLPQVLQTNNGSMSES